MRRRALSALAVVIAAHAFAIAPGCSSERAAACARFVELSATCLDPPEKREVSRAICENAHKHVGEEAGDERARAYVTWLNATLRLQAECARASSDCEGFRACIELRAPR